MALDSTMLMDARVYLPIFCSFFEKVMGLNTFAMGLFGMQWNAVSVVSADVSEGMGEKDISYVAQESELYNGREFANSLPLILVRNAMDGSVSVWWHDDHLDPSVHGGA